MSGVDAIGQAAIGELSDGPDVIIFAPAPTVTVGAAAPDVQGGGSALPPHVVVAVNAVAPSVSGGTYVVAPPAASVSVSGAAPFVTRSATVSISTSDVAAVVIAPMVAAGVCVRPTTIACAINCVAPFIKAGDAVTINAPAVTISAAGGSAEILGGQYIEASNTITMITPFGEIGSASIGEFAIGEGEPSTRVVKRGLLIRVSADPPFVSAGKSVFPSPRSVSVVCAPAEIDSRLRRIRIYAIAS